MGSNPIRVTIYVESESVSNEMDSDFPVYGICGKKQMPVFLIRPY